MWYPSGFSINKVTVVSQHQNMLSFVWSSGHMMGFTTADNEVLSLLSKLEPIRLHAHPLALLLLDAV